MWWIFEYRRVYMFALRLCVVADSAKEVGHDAVAPDAFHDPHQGQAFAVPGVSFDDDLLLLHFARCTGHAGEARAAQAQLDALEAAGQVRLPKGLR